MKRMYVTLGLILLFFVWALTSFGQKKPPVTSREDEIRRFFEMREEMHKRIRDKLLYGFGSDDDLFKGMDQMFEDAMNSNIKGLDSFAPVSKNYQMEWSDNGSGKVLTITPESPEQKLDINVAQGMITIKGTAEQKSAQGVARSNFSNSFSVPSECDESKVKMSSKEGKIVIELPYRTARTVTPTPKRDDRVPVPPSGEEVEI